MAKICKGGAIEYVYNITDVSFKLNKTDLQKISGI